MTKLFIAIKVPMALTANLAQLQPPATLGIRVVDPNQMHVTLHFVGTANVDALATALQPIAVKCFPLDFEGVWHFSSADGSTTLWAGVRASPELLDLHQQIASVLKREGYQLETRRYSPHVTLARGGSIVTAQAIAEFLSRNADFQISNVAISGFCLYSSMMTNSTPIYTIERHFPFVANRG
jgi:2'-5' RNA ligase